MKTTDMTVSIAIQGADEAIEKIKEVNRLLEQTAQILSSVQVARAIGSVAGGAIDHQGRMGP